MHISFTSDKIKVSGPKIDGSYSITFETGEYEVENVSKVLLIPRDVPIKVTVEIDE